MLFTVVLLLALAPATSSPECPQGASPATLNADGGVKDDFGQPGEPTSQSALLGQLPFNFAPFDHLSADRQFGHTLSGLPCTSTGAILTLHLRVNHSLASNDTIALQATGSSPTFVWSHSLASLLGTSWNKVGQTATLTLDLANLPLAAGGTISILNQINASGYLDVYLQDDTAVDNLSLRVDHCLTNDCNDNGIDDVCESPGQFSCSADQVMNLESGACCANTTVSATYATPCSGESFEITNDYAPAQGKAVNACFPAGITPVTFTLYTSSGEIQQCTVTVDVRDTTPPTITVCPRIK